jgi:hypothetical protein
LNSSEISLATRKLEDSTILPGLSSQLQNAVPGAMLASKATITMPERRTIQ